MGRIGLAEDSAPRLAMVSAPMEFAARCAGAGDVVERMGLPIIALPTHLSPDRVSEEIARASA